MNSNERVIVGMILDKLKAGNGLISSLWNLLHIETQNRIKGKVNWIFKREDRLIEIIDLSTDSRKIKAVMAFQEVMND